MIYHGPPIAIDAFHNGSLSQSNLKLDLSTNHASRISKLNVHQQVPFTEKSTSTQNVCLLVIYYNVISNSKSK
jgi:hypothetical protein